MNPNTPIQKTRCTPRLWPPAIRAGKALLTSIALAALLGGCATESKLLREDPGFTAESLRKGGLAVLGVVQVDEVPQARPPLIDALQRVLAGARPDIPLVRADRLHAAVGDSAMRLFLLGYQMRGDPDSVWLARAADAARAGARYGILARVEGTSVRYGTRNIGPTNVSGEGEHDVRVTGRDVRVQATIYDLATRTVVYRGKFIGSTDQARDLRPVSPDSLLYPDSLLPAPRPDQVPSQTFRPGTSGFPTPGPSDSPSDLGYPEAPTVARAAESAFLILARSLPGSPAPP